MSYMYLKQATAGAVVKVYSTLGLTDSRLRHRRLSGACRRVVTRVAGVSAHGTSARRSIHLPQRQHTCRSNTADYGRPPERFILGYT